jgi:hypothetical protein
MNGKLERKFLAHYLDKNFGVGTASYVRLGQDLDTYGEELNPQIDVKRNILGEQSVNHSGYQVQSTAEPFYAYENDPLFNQLALIANERRTGEGCQTTRVEVLVNAVGEVLWAYREDCWVIPNSVGGDTTGVQIPFTVYNSGNRVPGVWDTATKTFTPVAVSLDSSSQTVTVASGDSHTATLTATTTPAGGTVTWSSTNPDVATVSNEGLVTGVAVGTCSVIANYRNATASCVVTVTAS